MATAQQQYHSKNASYTRHTGTTHSSIRPKTHTHSALSNHYRFKLHVSSALPDRYTYAYAHAQTVPYLVLGDEVDDGLELRGGVLEHLGLAHDGGHHELVHQLVVLAMGLCVSIPNAQSGAVVVAHPAEYTPLLTTISALVFWFTCVYSCHVTTTHMPVP
jgi:hypothetical protein